MAITLCTRLQAVKPSATLALAARAAELKAAGKDILNLTVGEPDFDTPPHIKEAAIKAIHDGKTKYTPVDGTPELKKAIVEKLFRDNHSNYEPKQILVSCGAKHTIYNLMQALLNEGDEVVIPAPCWVSYPDIAKLSGAKPVIIPSSIKQQYKITAEQLRAAITPKTRLVILNSPSNPTGMVYSKKELLQFAEVLLENPHVLIATDDIYEAIAWTSEPVVNIVTACPDLYPRTIIVNGVSKTYSMTGWRIGYAAGPALLIDAMKKIQSQSTSNPCSISQAAAVAALTSDQAYVKDMVNIFRERHDYLLKSFNEVSGIQMIPADGAFYAFPDVQGAYTKVGAKNDNQFAEALINEIGLVIIPGSEFYSPGSIRLSYASDLKILQEAIKRLTQLLS